MKTVTKERPILFSGEMVRAILEGRKTQTRRILKVQPSASVNHFGVLHIPSERNLWQGLCRIDEEDFAEGDMQLCPYGQPGDRLWVRETFYLKKGTKTKIVYSDGQTSKEAHHFCWTAKDNEDYIKKPSIHMPRWASRITLEIVNVRVERLQDISEEDVIAEGALRKHFPNMGPGEYTTFFNDGNWHGLARDAFKYLWNKINGPGAWEKNLWVWVIEFKRGLFDD